jgi:hypothetical protein
MARVTRGTPRLGSTGSPDRWDASVRISGRPATLDIVFAKEQDRIESPFEMAIAK